MTYTWTDNAMQSGTTCNVDTVNTNLMHLKYNNQFYKNFIINGDMRIAQRCPLGSNKALSTLAQYIVDRFYAFCQASTISSGTLKQINNVNGFNYGFKYENVTISGTNLTLSVSQRIESLNALFLKNKVISISADCYQDTGTVITVTNDTFIPTTVDDFGTCVDTINGDQSLPSGIKTRLKWQGITLDDCSNGLGMHFAFNTGAITNKNLIISNIQLEIGSQCTDFEYRPYGQELALCQRYYEKSYDLGILPSMPTSSGDEVFDSAMNYPSYNVKYKVSKRSYATIGLYSPITSATGKWYDYSTTTDSPATIGNNGQNCFSVNMTCPAGHLIVGHWTADAEL